MDKKKYIQTVTEQIRCKRALPLVTKELEGHIEDQKSDYMKAGMNAEEAEEAAVLEMGDPVEVGVEMDCIHRPKMAWKMIGLIAILNLAGIVLMYLIRTSILADAGNNPGDVEWIASGIGGNINYLKSVMWTIIGLACMIGICYFDYSRIGKYGKLLTGGWIVVMGLSLFMGAVYINGAAYGIRFLFGRVLPLRPFLYLIVPAYAATLYSMRRKKSGYSGVVKAILWQILPVWIILRIPNLSMAISVEVTFMILLSIAVWKEWFEVNRKRTLITLWSLVILLPAAGIGVFVKLDSVANYQMARLSAFIHPESNDGTLGGMIRNMISGAHLAGRGDCEKIKFFNRDYMLTFIIHYYGIFAAVLIIAIVGGILIWFLQKTGHQKNQLGMIMGTGCVVVLLIQFIGYVLENLGYLKKKKTKQVYRKKNKLHIETYLTKENITIYVGKNNLQNDYLTFKMASRNDMWFHVKDMPGSHVVVHSEELNEYTIRLASKIAAYFSKGKHSSSVPVNYTQIKTLKKPQGAKPGQVILNHYSTIYIDPDDSFLNEINKID